MDKFGYIRGRRGPPGPQGKDAIELHTWCPEAVLEMFRKSEKCTYYFNTEKDGILNDGKIGLKDRFGENHAICLRNFHKPMKIGKFYGIPLKDSLYKIADIRTATTPAMICIFAFQFKVTSELSNENDYIFTTETATRGVTISKKSLNILGTDPMDLEYDTRGWNTLVIQYSCMTDDFDGKCFFSLNGRRGFFLPRKPIKFDSKDVYIGGHPKGKGFANVMLTNFEIYSKTYDTPPPEKYSLPEQIIVKTRSKYRDTKR